MASLDFDATETPTDIVAALSLNVGTAYAGQNVSTISTLFFREAVAMPDATAPAFRVESGSAFQIKPEPGQGVWLWTDEAPCKIILATRP